MSEKDHWEDVFRRRRPGQTSWYRPHLERSITFIEQAGIEKDAAIIDIGGGESTLVDDLLDRGYSDLTVLDISSTAIASAKARLGRRAASVTWIEEDITLARLPEHRYHFWHDRAVFHFLVDVESRRRYVAAVGRGLRPGGHIVVATFGHSAPEQCSGLDVVRYNTDELYGEFGRRFEKVSSCNEVHLTPWGSEQEFIYCYCRISE